MKRGKKLLVLLLVLVILVGATAVVGGMEQKAAEEAEVPQTIFSIDPDSVTNLGWDYSEKISFTAGENGWVCDQDAAFPVEESYLTAMLDTLTEVTSEKCIEAPENLDQYGLEVPICVVTVSDGESRTLSIGLETAVGGQRYVSNGDGNVYLVADSILDPFQYGLYDVLKYQTLPEVTNLTKMTVERLNGGFTITRQEDSGLVYSDDYIWFMDGKALDNELTQDLLDMVTNLNLSQCVDYNAEDLSGYGLDTPSATVTVYDGGEKAFAIEIGSTQGENCYLRLADSKMIYAVDSQLSQTLCYTTYEDLRPDDVLLMDWDTVESVTVTMDGEDYRLDRNAEIVTAEDGTTSEETVWKLNGEEKAFSDILETLTSMTSTGYASGIVPEGEPALTFRIDRDRETFTQVELAFYPYNSSSCVVTLDGEATVLASRTDVAELVDSINSTLEK